MANFLRFLWLHSMGSSLKKPGPICFPLSLSSSMNMYPWANSLWVLGGISAHGKCFSYNSVTYWQYSLTSSGSRSVKWLRNKIHTFFNPMMSSKGMSKTRAKNFGWAKARRTTLPLVLVPPERLEIHKLQKTMQNCKKNPQKFAEKNL